MDFQQRKKSGYLKSLLSGVEAWARCHMLASTSLVFVVLICAVLFFPFAGINVRYQVNFDQPLSTNDASVVFRFDENPQYPEFAQQNAEIAGKAAFIRLDSLNDQSSEMSVEVQSDEDAVHLQSFEAAVSVSGRVLWRVCEIAGNDIQTYTDGSTMVAAFDEMQMDTIHGATQRLSEMRVIAILCVVAAFILVVIKNIFLRGINWRDYAGIVILLTVFVLFAADLWLNRPSASLGFVSYKILIVAILSIAALLTALNVKASTWRLKNRAVMCAVNYVLVACYVIVQFFIYVRYFANSPDESAHLSYIAYERVHHELIPSFSQIQLYRGSLDFSGVLSLTDGVQFNQLGHPPLYYLLMSHLPGIWNTGDTVYYHVNLLRGESFLLGFTGIVLAFYIGFTRIRKVPLLHLLFAAIIISPPNLIMVISGLNNDSLTLLTVTVFVMGCIRFYEKRYNPVTFLLIALGITTTVLTKLTAGMIVCVAAVLIVLYAVFAEKNLLAIANKSFVLTLPIYIIPVAYFVALWMKYHTIQPSYQKLATNEYLHGPFYQSITDRQQMTVAQYILYYWKNFVDSWYSYPFHGEIVRSGALSIGAVAVTSIILMPLMIFLVKKNHAGQYLTFGVIAICVVSVYQFVSAMNGFYENGYGGGYQSRYYLCAITVMGLSIIWLIVHRIDQKLYVLSSPHPDNPDNTVLPRSMTWCVVAFILLLVFDGFISSLLYHVPSIIGA